MSANYKSNLGVISFDSFKWRIPLHLVKVVNEDLLDAVLKQTVNTKTGNIISEEQIQNNSLNVNFEGYHIHFAISKLFGGSDLVILINSKLLEEKYLDGISMLNIETLYKKIISCNVVSLTFEEFLLGNCSDIDIKKDIECDTVEEFNNFTLQLFQSSRMIKKLGHGSRRWATRENAGIQWNKREGSTYPHPFLKVYHKGVEVKESKNKEFFNQYIDTNAVSKRVRIEATIKNKEMADRFGIKGLKLHEMLSLSQDKLHEIINHCIVRNIEPRIPKQKPRAINKLSPTDKIIFQSLTLALSQDISFENALEHLLHLFGSEQQERNAKARQKQRITALYEEQIKGEIYELKAIKTSTFFTQLGWE